MTDQVDKYVLQYMVETKDSLKRIEELQKKQNEVDKISKKNKDSMKMLGGAIKNLAYEAGGAGEAAVGLSEGLMSLAAATGPIAAVVGVIMLLKKALQETKATMDDLTSQRDLGAKIGLSGVSVENITRNLRSAPGSQIDQRGVNDLLEKIGTKLQSAYIDPTQMSGDAIALRQAGVSINGAGGGINDTVSALDQLQAKFKSVSDEQARGIGRVLGLTNQQVDAMRNLGTTMNETTNMTQAEAIARVEALQKTEELTVAQNQLSDHWRQLKEDLLVNIIPALDGLVTALDKLLQVARNAGEAAKNPARETRFVADYFSHFGENFKKVATGDLKGFFTSVGKEWTDSAGDISTGAQAILKTADQSAQATTQSQTDMQRIINMFAQSVNQFSNTIDERQAWAAWAGEIGRAGGLGSGGNKSYGLTGTGGNTSTFNAAVQTAAQYGLNQAAHGRSAADAHNYDAIFQMAAAKTGLPADLIKRVAMAESSLNAGAKSAAGAMGLMGIMPSNFKAYGVTNPLDPTQNIMAGAQILADNYKRYGDINDALRAYNGGTDKSHWNNPETAAYVGRIAAQNATIQGENFSASPDLHNNLLSSWSKYSLDPDAKPLFSFNGSPFINAGAGGESREKSQLANIQGQLAQRLGLANASQLQTGGVSRGDVQWAASNMMAEMLNSRYTLLNQMSVPGLTTMAKANLNSQLRTTDLNIQSMMRYMPQIQSSAPQGERNITIGQGAVQVIVQGSNVSPEQLAKEINNTIGDHINEAVNAPADAMAY